ncbi:hypothetical protein HJ588_04325 [Flexivirga sp. ID2601S]|uniref:Polyketide cyclase n=1 Tax=Flexivirga aerilata TaxID=1656889 RepID=A0A849AGU9_9MICO|nr:SRPBCC family protein [Flexivirga aerilata]NNG38501.1 hypothetical protein [Flexivirga aerilata]
MNVVDTLTIDAPRDRIFDTFADLTQWPRILPDTVGVEVLYHDGFNQEFTMTVLRPAGEETVHGFRYLRRPHQLELVQTTPPPIMTYMNGVWDFTTNQDGSTVVTASRVFELRSVEDGGPAGDEAQFAEKLRGLLHHNLTLFKEAIENA